jgi:cytoskeletal protein CcmA (bactofilin family)
MLEVKRNVDSCHNDASGTATATARAHSPATASSTTDNTNARKPSVIAHGARHNVKAAPVRESREFQAKVPVITGEVNFRGSIAADGCLSGQLGASSRCLNVKQKSNATFESKPELDGELSFRDVVRVNGHIAGTLSSSQGTLIVDVGARVDANIDVAVAMISGTVNGDIIARERIEVGPVARIHGNIWTRSITIKDGAIFEGVCSMIRSTLNWQG